MSLYRKFAAGAGAALVSAASHAVIIDDFTVSQGPIGDSTNNGAAVIDSVSGSTANILGGIRDMSINLTSAISTPVTASMGTGVTAGNATFNFSTPTLATATGIVQWDKTALFSGPGLNGINPTGLGGIDLTAGGNLLGIQIITYNADHPFTFKVNAYSSANQWSTVELNAHVFNPGAPGASITSFIPFLGFGACGAGPIGDVISVTCGSGGAVNFANLGALELVLFGTPNLDLTIGLLSSVPEPGVLGLIGASMFGLAFARRRSLKKQA